MSVKTRIIQTKMKRLTNLWRIARSKFRRPSISTCLWYVYFTVLWWHEMKFRLFWCCKHSESVTSWRCCTFFLQWNARFNLACIWGKFFFSDLPNFRNKPSTEASLYSNRCHTLTVDIPKYSCLSLSGAVVGTWHHAVFSSLRVSSVYWKSYEK